MLLAKVQILINITIIFNHFVFIKKYKLFSYSQYNIFD